MNWAVPFLIPFFASGVFAAENSEKSHDRNFDFPVHSHSTSTGDSDSAPGQDFGSSSDWDRFIAALPFSTQINWGLDWKTGDAYSRNASLTFSPGSVEKIITATTALKWLGPEFRFYNAFDGKLNSKKGILFQPRFTISGDPTWGIDPYDSTVNERLEKMSESLFAQGVRLVYGPINVKIVGQKIQNVTRPSPWKAEWAAECYAALPTPFMADANCGTFKILSPTSAKWIEAWHPENEPATITTPLEVNVTEVAVKANEDDQSIEPTITPVFDPSGSRVLKYQITGNYTASRTTFSVPVHDSDRWLRNLFIAGLKRANIAYKELPIVMYADRKIFDDLSSKPLREILPPFLQQSINLVGDRLYLQIAESLGAMTDSDPEYLQLSDLVSNSTLTSPSRIYDGSGLIADDHHSPELLYQYLNSLLSQPYFPDFLNALPVAGVSGTLKNRLLGAPTEGNVFAKTGTLDGVSAIAGYYRSSEVCLEPFVMMSQSMVAGSKVKSLEDLIVMKWVKEKFN